ncbi:MAG: hypothetical protein QOF90_465 [Acetobacteraceae bacterium]|jgi:plasmid stability protein|nr:hypothetical protein [Acetobacteraceae bacterium]
MEEEVRAILRQGVETEQLKTGLGTRIAALFATNGLSDGVA